MADLPPPDRLGADRLGADPLGADPLGMAAAQAVASIPRDQGGPVFRAPWEAQAFAMTLMLHKAGLFAWSEWAAVLGAEIKRAQAAGDPDRGDTYYHHWLAALERMLAEKGVTNRAQLLRHRCAWKRAAERTPHGAPIALSAEDYR